MKQSHPSHLGSRNIGCVETREKGRIKVLPGQGFRLSKVYEHRRLAPLRKCWIEQLQQIGKQTEWITVWDSGRKLTPAHGDAPEVLKSALAIRDAAFPGARVMEWIGTNDGTGLWIVHPAKGEKYFLLQE